MAEEVIKECEFYLPLRENCNEILDDNGNEVYKCSSRQDCYYKQLKRLEQENKELLEARNHFMAINLKYYNALEEIRILATKNVSIESFVKIQNRINECLGG